MYAAGLSMHLGLTIVMSYIYLFYVTSASSFSDDPTTPPMITVTIVVSGCETPIAGQSYTLTCSVSGASTTTYQWRKNGTMMSQTGPTLSFSPLRFTDAGQYTCEVIVNSMTHTDDENVVITSKITKPLYCVYYSFSLSLCLSLSVVPSSPTSNICDHHK